MSVQTPDIELEAVCFSGTTAAVQPDGKLLLTGEYSPFTKLIVSLHNRAIDSKPKITKLKRVQNDRQLKEFAMRTTLQWRRSQLTLLQEALKTTQEKLNKHMSNFATANSLALLTVNLPPTVEYIP